jgi:hypothetical protein
MDTVGYFRCLALLNMQHNGAKCTNNIEENNMKLRQALQNVL